MQYLLSYTTDRPVFLRTNPQFDFFQLLCVHNIHEMITKAVSGTAVTKYIHKPLVLVPLELSFQSKKDMRKKDYKSESIS
jgi:hypothetical protein